MAIIQYLEMDYASSELKSLYRWIRRRLLIRRETVLSESRPYVREDNYSPKHIVKLLTQKNCNGKAFFHFRNMNDYISLSSSGQLNVKGGEGGLFKPWGNSEFKYLRPKTVIQELENEIIAVNFIAASDGRCYSFDSYKEFINWLSVK